MVDKLRKLNVDPEEWCSCYYCISHFPAKYIKEWTGDEQPMAICPNCSIDSVMRGYVENSKLEELYEYWFNTFDVEDIPDEDIRDIDDIDFEKYK